MSQSSYNAAGLLNIIYAAHTSGFFLELDSGLIGTTKVWASLSGKALIINVQFKYDNSY